MESSTRRKTHVALFTALGLGHVIPFGELARLLATEHACKVTIITFAWEPNSRQEMMLKSLDSSTSGLDIHLLPIGVHMLNVDKDTSMKTETAISLVTESSKPSFHSALRSLNGKVDAFIGDFFCTTLMDVASKLGIPSYLFFTSGMSMMALMLSVPKLTDRHQGSFCDSEHAFQIDGLPSILGQDLPTSLQDRTDEAFTWFVYHGRRYADYSGIFVNTCEDLEPKALQALRIGNGELLPETVPPVYPIGPLISTQYQENSAKAACLDWLDEQPDKSVLFISFGSGNSMSHNQITELALGLKECGQRFLWVLRRPLVRGSSMTVDTEVGEILPPGFLEETEGRGMIVSTWAPQMLILGHPSVGGFMYHGGWNSTLESVWHGVPTIVWPLFAEQRLNKEIVAKEMKSGIGVSMGADGGVKKEEVVRCVREIMEGEEGKKVREIVRDLMEKVRASVVTGGSSCCALADGLSMFRRSE